MKDRQPFHGALDMKSSVGVHMNLLSLRRQPNKNQRPASTAGSDATCSLDLNDS